MKNINNEIMTTEIEAALVSVAGDKRWTNAITRASVEIETNPYLHDNGHALLILSASDEIYSANGTCTCKAFVNHKPCWHRAAARLVKRYNEVTTS